MRDLRRTVWKSVMLGKGLCLSLALDGASPLPRIALAGMPSLLCYRCSILTEAGTLTDDIPRHRLMLAPTLLLCLAPQQPALLPPVKLDAEGEPIHVVAYAGYVWLDSQGQARVKQSLRLRPISRHENVGSTTDDRSAFFFQSVSAGGYRITLRRSNESLCTVDLHAGDGTRSWRDQQGSSRPLIVLAEDCLQVEPERVALIQASASMRDLGSDHQRKAR
ncbi:MAG: hypothetical protein ACI835_001752 [Planctomycetota bacterium]|jgi:hypothetical protein